MNLKNTTALVLLTAGLASAAGNVSGAVETVEGIVGNQQRQMILTAAGKNRYELKGRDLHRLVGSRARITGAIDATVPVRDGLRTLHVQTAQVLLAAVPPGESPEAPAGGGGGGGGVGAGAAGGAAKAGVSKIVVGALVTGAAVGGTVVTLYAADVIGGDEKPASRP